VNKQIGEKIRSIRASKGYSQANIAEDLGITAGAYAKIERGETDANTSRLLQIAKILEVNITEFFADPTTKEKQDPGYGYATKEEVRSLSEKVDNLTGQIQKLTELVSLPKTKSRVKKARK
jgi:transcriptional regulator with XRE-family HTH domain